MATVHSTHTAGTAVIGAGASASSGDDDDAPCGAARGASCGGLLLIVVGSISNGGAGPCRTVAPGRTARSRAAVSTSRTPSARRATHTAYAAAATAYAQRFVVAAAQRAVVGVWLLLLVLVAGIVFGLGGGLGLKHICARDYNEARIAFGEGWSAHRQCPTRARH